MSLKGYEWLVNGEVVMCYRFKDLTLTLLHDVTTKQLDEFKTWLINNNHEVRHVDTWQSKIL